MDKLITFAVPCYNSASYMEKCVNSLLKAGEDAQIILVDDGSTKDDTAKICDDFASRYPSIITAIHQPNGGHGQAVNTGIKNAVGKYFKVVDSDDWADEQALEKFINTLKNLNEDVDAFFMNYVYEYTANNTTRVISYKGKMPENRVFAFDEMKPLEVGKFVAMHAVVYRTQFIRDCELVLPEHTFYVDNIFIYKPLPLAKKLYYLNVDFYRYFIGREDQSVNEQIIMKRIDQHIKVTKILFDLHDLDKIKVQSKKLYKYMFDFMHVMMLINSIYLIKLGDKESYQKRLDLWQEYKLKQPTAYKKSKRKFSGMVASKNKFVCWLCKTIYVVVRKIFKFN